MLRLDGPAALSQFVRVTTTTGSRGPCTAQKQNHSLERSTCTDGVQPHITCTTCSTRKGTRSSVCTTARLLQSLRCCTKCSLLQTALSLACANCKNVWHAHNHRTMPSCSLQVLLSHKQPMAANTLSLFTLDDHNTAVHRHQATSPHPLAQPSCEIIRDHVHSMTDHCAVDRCQIRPFPTEALFQRALCIVMDAPSRHATPAGSRVCVASRLSPLAAGTIVACACAACMCSMNIYQLLCTLSDTIG